MFKYFLSFWIFLFLLLQDAFSEIEYDVDGRILILGARPAFLGVYGDDSCKELRYLEDWSDQYNVCHIFNETFSVKYQCIGNTIIKDSYLYSNNCGGTYHSQQKNFNSSCTNHVGGDNSTFSYSCQHPSYTFYEAKLSGAINFTFYPDSGCSISSRDIFSETSSYYFNLFTVTVQCIRWIQEGMSLFYAPVKITSTGSSTATEVILESFFPTSDNCIGGANRTSFGMKGACGKYGLRGHYFKPINIPFGMNYTFSDPSVTTIYKNYTGCEEKEGFLSMYTNSQVYGKITEYPPYNRIMLICDYEPTTNNSKQTMVIFDDESRMSYISINTLIGCRQRVDGFWIRNDCVDFVESNEDLKKNNWGSIKIFRNESNFNCVEDGDFYNLDDDGELGTYYSMYLVANNSCSEDGFRFVCERVSGSSRIKLLKYDNYSICLEHITNYSSSHLNFSKFYSSEIFSMNSCTFSNLINRYVLFKSSFCYGTYNCYGYDSLDIENVCRGEGKCVYTDRCYCNERFYGNECQERISLKSKLYFMSDPIRVEIPWVIPHDDLISVFGNYQISCDKVITNNLGVGSNCIFSVDADLERPQEIGSTTSIWRRAYGDAAPTYDVLLVFAGKDHDVKHNTFFRVKPVLNSSVEPLSLEREYAFEMNRRQWIEAYVGLALYSLLSLGIICCSFYVLYCFCILPGCFCFRMVCLKIMVGMDKVGTKLKSGSANLKEKRFKSKIRRQIRNEIGEDDDIVTSLKRGIGGDDDELLEESDFGEDIKKISKDYLKIIEEEELSLLDQ